MTKILGSFILALTLCLIPVSASAQNPTTFSIGEPGDSTFRLGNSTGFIRLSQGFVATSGSVTSIQIPLLRVGSPTQVITVSIKSSLMGASLYTKTIDPSRVISTSRANPTWITITPPSPLSMTSGIVTLSVTHVNSNNYYRWRTNSHDPYNNGMFYKKEIAQGSYDGLLRIANVPTQATGSSIIVSANVDVSPLTSTESPQGTSITTAGTITDATGVKWTVASGMILRDNVATVSANVTLLLYLNHTAYQQNSAGGWWMWVSGGWQATSDPRVTSSPSTTPVSPSSITVQDNGNNFLQVGLGAGTSWIDDGIWGAGNLKPGTFTGINGTTYEQANGASSVLGPSGEIAWRMTWKWPIGTTEVKAYPSAVTGAKPGNASTWTTPGGNNIKLPDGSISDVYPSGATPNTFFPLQLPLAPLYSSFSYTQNVTPTGRGHLSYDLWLQNNPTQCHGWDACREITHEIMIPLTYWGNYGSYHGDRNPEWYYKDAIIGGRLWHVYHVAPSVGPWTWDFTAFEPDGPTVIPPSTLDLSQFTSYMSAQGWVKGPTWMVSTELGIEPEVGTGDMTVSNYRVWR